MPSDIVMFLENFGLILSSGNHLGEVSRALCIHMGFFWVLSPVSSYLQKHIIKRTGCIKLPLGVNECGFRGAIRGVFTGLVLDLLQPLIQITGEKA